MPRGKSTKNTLSIHCADGIIRTVIVCTLCIANNPKDMVHEFRNRNTLWNHTKKVHPSSLATAARPKTCAMLYRHSQAGKALAAFLQLQFEAKGVNVWRDVRNFQSSQDLKFEIRSQLAACDYAVVLLTSGDLDKCLSNKDDLFAWELRTCMEQFTDKTHMIMHQETFGQIVKDGSLTRTGLLAELSTVCEKRVILKWDTDFDLHLLADKVVRSDEHSKMDE
ncbi:hypothetical protein BCR37DRAFT_218750 [Protomyces lactucae-debilis]|uniref:TIR domain-containing protein n=1 Tax=Protomyces lactucae-debilis TaxID=2754530 RepID=A0A1Y2FRZ8_PROLT|nr:uncharacterized protein BCR37DRAFT_218750 [Protomyces lactucae-debilis]ORY86357.1 hypothetical protein BCR37DRAFT_218750 [Protomyces lactucae-debilis]